MVGDEVGNGLRPLRALSRMETEKKGRICVTGAGGFLASWVVKLLLSKGYLVHGTVRDLGDEKTAHLKRLEGASENLQLFKADLLDYASLCKAIIGCDGVLHVASPVPLGSVPDPQAELVEPAVSGTLNVLKACSEAEVKKVIYVSSVAALVMNPNHPKGEVLDENCWSDEDYCRTTENWYCLSKTAAEREALEYGDKNGLHVVTICPSLIFGPMLQPTMNTSSIVLYKILTGEYENKENGTRVIVDVRDVGEAVLLAYEKPEASGRYVCASNFLSLRDLVEKLRSLHPSYNYPKNFIEVEDTLKMSSDKLKMLGWKPRHLEETLSDTVTYFEESGLLKK